MKFLTDDIGKCVPGRLHDKHLKGGTRQHHGSAYIEQSRTSVELSLIHISEPTRQYS